MNIQFFIVIFFLSGSLHASWFAHDRAAQALQQNNLSQAKTVLQELLLHDPYNATVLYDAGIVSYKTNEFQPAAAYFKKAAQSAVDKQLQEQAYFNLGNTQVDLKELEQAIKSYEKVLELNPENERAKHNLEKVKEMLEQQKQQQEQKDQKKKQDKGQDKDQKQQEGGEQKQEKRDWSKGDQGDEGEQQEKQEQEEGGEKSESPEGDEKEGDAGKGEEGVGDDESEKEGEQGGGDQPDQSTEEQAELEGGDQAQEGSEGEQPQDEDSKLSHNNSPDNVLDQDKQSLAQAQQEATDKQENKLEPWLVKLLQAHEEKDAELNKRMMRATVNKKLAGQDGQNCW